MYPSWIHIPKRRLTRRNYNTGVTASWDRSFKKSIIFQFLMTVFSNDGKTRQRPKATKFDDVSLKKQHWLDAELEWHQLKLQLLMQTFRFLAAWPSSHLEKNNRHSFLKVILQADRNGDLWWHTQFAEWKANVEIKMHQEKYLFNCNKKPLYNSNH